MWKLKKRSFCHQVASAVHDLLHLQETDGKTSGNSLFVLESEPWLNISITDRLREETYEGVTEKCVADTCSPPLFLQYYTSIIILVHYVLLRDTIRLVQMPTLCSTYFPTSFLNSSKLHLLNIGVVFWSAEEINEIIGGCMRIICRVTQRWATYIAPFDCRFQYL